MATTATSVPPPELRQAEIEESIGRSRGRRIRGWLVRGLLIAAGLALVALAVRAYLDASSPGPVSYETEAASRRDLEVTVTATGTLEPRNVVDVGSEISGRIDRVLVDFNDEVEKGQILAELDTDIYRAQVEQARAQLQVALASLTQAKATGKEAASALSRAEALYPSRAVSLQYVEQMRASSERAAAAEKLAAAEIRRTRAALELAETNLRRAVIRSPIDGVVLSRTVEVGQTVVAALQAPVLFRLAEDLRQMTVSVDVDEADVGQVRDGQEATFTVSAYYGREFPARVVSVHNAPDMVDQVVTYEAELQVDNRELLLRPGMTATARILVARHEDVLAIPNQALRFSPDGQRGEEADIPARNRIWVLRDGEPVEVPVVLGGQNDSYAIVTDGELEPGDEVIVNRRSGRS